MPPPALRSSRSLAHLIALALIGGLIGPAVSRDALAYKCTPVTNASPALSQAWDQRCIPYWIGRRGTLFAGDSRRQLIAQSFRVWSSTANACTDLTFNEIGYTDQAAQFNPKTPCSNQNVVVAIQDAAQMDVFPRTGLLAITLTSYSTLTGEIFDADILFNGVDFKFEDVADEAACRSTTRSYDLRNTLIHEMGHFIGFDHTPDPGSTMYASADPCETKKRDLTDDDGLGLCTVYPKDQPLPHTCNAPASYGTDADVFRNQCDHAAHGCGNSGGGCEGVTVPPEATAARSGWIDLGLLAGGLTLALAVRLRARRRT